MLFSSFVILHALTKLWCFKNFWMPLITNYHTSQRKYLYHFINYYYHYCYRLPLRRRVGYAQQAMIATLTRFFKSLLLGLSSVISRALCFLNRKRRNSGAILPTHIQDADVNIPTHVLSDNFQNHSPSNDALVSRCFANSLLYIFGTSYMLEKYFYALKVKLNCFIHSPHSQQNVLPSSLILAILYYLCIIVDHVLNQVCYVVHNQ